MNKQSKGTWIGSLLDKRQMVPRWHSPGDAIAYGERNSAIQYSASVKSQNKWIRILVEETEKPQADTSAHVELAEMRFICNEHIEDAAQEKIIDTRSAWIKAASLGEAWLYEEGVPILDRVTREHNRVKSIRRSLREHPKQSFMWAELARSQLILGADKNAEKAMTCAVQLAPNSVYLRRCASRMYLHLKDEEKALSVIRRHPGLREDPRLVSAEIAVSSVTGHSSRYAHLAKNFVDEIKFRPEHRSEVAAAIATLELENGKARKARDLFEKSLRKPSENTLAQVQWALGRDSKILIPQEAWEIPRSYEADALAARMRNDWIHVLDSCERWLESEPFSAKSAEIGSFALFTDEQSKRAHRLATVALSINPKNILLLNNRAVASVYTGNIEEAFVDLKIALNFGAASDTHLVATLGLIAYRLGWPEIGAKCYGTAVAKFIREKNADSVLLACLFWVREVARFDPVQARMDYDYLKKNSFKLTRGRRDPEIESMLKLVGDEVQQDLLVVPSIVTDAADRINSVFESFSVEKEIVSIRDNFLDVVR